MGSTTTSAVSSPLATSFTAPERSPQTATNASAPGVASGPSVTISDSCVARLRQLSQQRGVHVALRISVDGGGCSGFQYAFELEEWPSDAPPGPHSLRGDGDVLVQQDEVSVIVDPVSLGFVEGATIDYKQELISSSFRVENNPQSEASCGCGVSFAPKME